MSTEVIRIISVGVSKDCCNKLKTIAVKREISLAELVREVLENFSNKKSFDVEGK